MYVMLNMLYGILEKEPNKKEVRKNLNTEDFQEFVKRWKNCGYKYNRAHALFDRNKTEVQMEHSTCKEKLKNKNYQLKTND